MRNLKEIQELKSLQSLEFIARSIVEGFIAGLHKSPYHGFSVEFSEHRPYNNGESIRFIDWKLYARTEKLFVKQFEQETNLRSYVLLDLSSSMLFPVDAGHFNKLEFEIYLAAAFITLFQRQRDASGLVLFSNEIEEFLPAKLNVVHQKLLFTRLQQVLDRSREIERKKTVISPLFHQIADRLPKRSLVIIFSDFFVQEDLNQIINSLQHFKYNKHEVIIFHLYDRKFEYNFEFDNRLIKFINLETGESLKLNPNFVRQKYREAVSSYFNQLKLRSGQLGLDFVQIDVNQDFAEVLIAYLLKRQKMF